MSTNRTQTTTGPVDARRLPRGPHGRALCRRCGVEVPKGRRTFCGESCVHEWRLRTDPAYLRQQVFKRDRGVCATCGTDTEALAKELNRLKYPEAADRKRALGIPEGRYTYWDADHRVPVVEGGGECDLDNIRTLCIPCHKRVTAELAARRAAQRRGALVPKGAVAHQGTLGLDDPEVVPA